MQVPGHQDAGDQAAAFWAGGGIVHSCQQLVQLPSQFRVEVAVLVGAVEGERERGNGARVQAGRHDRVGVGLRRVQQGGLSPPGITHRLSQVIGQALVADVDGGEVLLEGVVGKAVLAAFPLDKQPVGTGVGEEILGAGPAAQATQRRPDFGQHVFTRQVRQPPLHHRVGQAAQHRFLLLPGQLRGEVLGFLPPPQHDLADLRIQPGAPAGQRPPVAVHVSDHRQQQRVDRQVIQGRRLIQPPEQILGTRPGAGGDARVVGAGAMPLHRQVPALNESGHLLTSEAADLQYLCAVDARGAVAMRAGGDDIPVCRVLADLTFRPRSHPPAVFLPGDLIQAIQQHQALTGGQQPLQPALRFRCGQLAERAAQQIRQRHTRISEDRRDMITQVQQDRHAVPAAAPVQAGLPGSMAQQRGLPAARGSDDRQHHRLGPVQELRQERRSVTSGGKSASNPAWT